MSGAYSRVVQVNVLDMQGKRKKRQIKKEIKRGSARKERNHLGKAQPTCDRDNLNPLGRAVPSAALRPQRLQDVADALGVRSPRLAVLAYASLTV